MKLFTIKTSFYLLPIYFFVLSLSPNISGDRIGLVLVSVYLLLVPVSNYSSYRLRRLRSSNIKFDYAIKDFISLIILLGAFYIGWSISWEYCIVQLLYLLLIVFTDTKMELKKGVAGYLIFVVYGTIFYSMIYLGLNQYSFSILFGLANIVPAILVGTIIISTFYIDKLVVIASTENRNSNKLSLVLLYQLFQVLAFGIYFYVATELKYVIYFALAMSFPFLFIIWDKNRVEKNATQNYARSLSAVLWSLPICQTLFFVYYFLETTQVLQAIKGGY